MVEYSTKCELLYNIALRKKLLGNSMPTDTLFCRPIPDFDEIWQAWRSTEETNPYQVSTHFNHF